MGWLLWEERPPFLMKIGHDEKSYYLLIGIDAHFLVGRRLCR